MEIKKLSEWVNFLPADVRSRLAACCSTKDDIQVLADIKWWAMKECGMDKKGFVKEDALVSILELLDSNGLYIDLTREEYDELRNERR